VTADKGDVVESVPSLESVDPVQVCMPSEAASQGVTLTRLPDSVWGGRRAVVVEVGEWGRHLQAWCVVAPYGYVQVMGIFEPGSGTDEEDNAAMAALAANWRWK